MPVSNGKRTAIASYTWGGWGSPNDLTQFRDVFQPEQGIFSPSYPLVPPERERVRLFPAPQATVLPLLPLLPVRWKFQLCEGQ